MTLIKYIRDKLHKHAFDIGVDVLSGVIGCDFNRLRVDYSYPPSFFKSVCISCWLCRCGMLKIVEISCYNNGSIKEGLEHNAWIQNKFAPFIKAYCIDENKE